MSKQPYCICCGKAIAKVGRTVYLHATEEIAARQPKTSWSRHVVGEARTKADCQKYTNGTVISTKKWYVDQGLIGSFNEWDGETYADPFFCNGNCAKVMAYAAARAGYTLKPRENAA